MMLGRRPGALGLGVDLDLTAGDLDALAALFGESGGFLLEVAPEHLDALRAACAGAGLEPLALGRVNGDGRLRLAVDGAPRVDLDLEPLRRAWQGTLPALFTMAGQGVVAGGQA
jgi:hypothetical protein